MIGAYRTNRSFTPDELGSTLFAALGFPTHAELRDQLNRPLAFCNGQVIEELYTA